MLESFHELKKQYHFNFHLKEGVIYLLTGENGVGKSTFFDFLLLELLDKSVNFSLMPQESLTPLISRRVKDILRIFEEKNKGRIISSLAEDLGDLLEGLGLKERGINDLSGGENQLLKIYLALYWEADLYCFDEPEQFLDEKHRNLFFSFLTVLMREKKKIIIITHRTFQYEIFQCKRLMMEKKESIRSISEIPL